MILPLYIRNLVLGFLLFCLHGCAANYPTSEHSVLDNKQLLEDQQWYLWRQNEKLDEMAISQEVLGESLQEIKTTLLQLQELSEKAQAEVSPKPITKEAALSPDPQQIIHIKANAGDGNKTIIGRNEWIWLDLAQQRLKARVDTGALTSALNAINIQPFERNGKKWVRFQLSTEKDAPSFESPLVRYVRIRQASAKGLDRRPVVKLMVRMGDIAEETRFTLNDRDSMLYPVLLGREFMRDIMIVDVSKKFTQTKYEPPKEEQTDMSLKDSVK